ncbi:1,3-beta-glucan synthase subunit FKS1-like, domain-1 [Artemisia annua]|uniref:1,3-beta-glucan synthase subunit FKS1-like, domain-1 n=1 Tax=Artemisia annua TaxID=35608 RepID=A0A2U1M7L7_ARTAN|nr:1,3-beta-glucan synthase subunit FKS1-like, domain-1 [Artemisia annua]
MASMNKFGIECIRSQKFARATTPIEVTNTPQVSHNGLIGTIRIKMEYIIRKILESTNPIKTLKKGSFELTDTTSTRNGIQLMGFFKCIKSTCSKAINKDLEQEISRFYAFEKAHKLDPISSGRGVRQFKTALLQRLDRENDPTLIGRMKKSDALEMQSFYPHYYSTYVQPFESAVDKADGPAQLSKAYRTATVLLEVLEAVNHTQAVDVDQEVTETHEKVAQKTDIPSE